MFTPGFEPLCQLAPRADQVLASTTALGLALTAAVWMVNRIHDHPADGRTNTLLQLIDIAIKAGGFQNAKVGVPIAELILEAAKQSQADTN